MTLNFDELISLGIDDYKNWQYESSREWFQKALSAAPKLGKLNRQLLGWINKAELQIAIQSKVSQYLEQGFYEDAIAPFDSLIRYWEEKSGWDNALFEEARNNALFPQMKNFLMGFTDYEGNNKIAYKYISAPLGFIEGLCLVEDKNGYNFINRNGHNISEAYFDFAIAKFNEGLTPVQKGKHWGYMNKDGEVVIDFIFTSANPFYEGVAVVNNKGKYGFINSKGEKVISEFERTSDFSEGLAPVKKNDLWGFINNLGEVVIDFVFDSAIGFRESKASVRIGQKWFCINKDNGQVFQNHFDWIGTYSSGYATALLKNKYYTINNKGVLLCEQDLIYPL